MVVCFFFPIQQDLPHHKVHLVLAAAFGSQENDLLRACIWFFFKKEIVFQPHQLRCTLVALGQAVVSGCKMGTQAGAGLTLLSSELSRAVPAQGSSPPDGCRALGEVSAAHSIPFSARFPPHVPTSSSLPAHRCSEVLVGCI